MIRLGCRSRPVSDPPPWVEVQDEPMHVQLLAREGLRVYEARITPGSATRYHRHHLDTFYVVMSGGRFATQEPFRQRSDTRLGNSVSPLRAVGWAMRRWLTGSVHVPRGVLMFQPHARYPLVHRLIAATSNRHPLRMLGIEIHDDRPLAPFTFNLGIPVEYRHNHATAYRLSLPAGSEEAIVLGSSALLVVCSGAADLESSTADRADDVSAGSIRWLEGPRAVTVRSVGSADLDALMVVTRPPDPLQQRDR